MKRILNIFGLLILAINQLFAQTEWLLKNDDTNINVSLMDSITYTKDNDVYLQNLWYKGEIIERIEIQEGITYIPKQQNMEYEYCTLDEDGIEAVYSETGLYAILQSAPDSTGLLFSCGGYGNDDYCCMYFDKLGYLRNIRTVIGDTYQVLYMPHDLWLVDSKADVVAKIPYLEFSNNNAVAPKTKMPKSASRSSNILNTIFNGGSIGYTIGGYLGSPKKSLLLDLMNLLAKGFGNRNVQLIGNIIKLGFNPDNPYDWYNTLNAMNQISFFGNATITALDAIQNDVCTFTTPCKVEGLSTNTGIFNDMEIRHEELIDYSYTLSMSASDELLFHKEQYTKNIKINGDGTYDDFVFDFKELQTLYNYAPFLTLAINLKKSLSEQEIRELKNAVLALDGNANFDIDDFWYNTRVSCTISGNANSLVTGAVSSQVEKINNVKNTTADIVCSFSNVPKGAECKIIVTRKGSDMGILFDAEPGKDNQIVKVSGLLVNTEYIASSYINYSGVTYNGIRSVEFSTNGPSGSVVSIQDITDKSAIATCNFNGIEEGTEVGIIVKSSNQTLTFTGSSYNGEQNITITGLTPNTSYSCYAYTRTANHYNEENSSISFKTKLPDISGTWSCTEKYYTGWDYSQENTKTYTITLHEDGSADVNDGTSYENARWSFSSNGKVTVSVNIMSTQTQNIGTEYEGTVDNIQNPTKITGGRYTWAYNQVIGYVRHDDYHSIVMTK